MDIIDEVRREREDLARVLKRHPGIRRVVEELYPDSAHFIFELLQNAEDTGATEAHFLLTNDALLFEHNGRPFEPRDIYAITDIGEGTKANDDDKIGRFGVGFKAVFAYSETPHIWSPTYSFKITDLVLPAPLDPDPSAGSKTRFKFPFNNPKKKPEAAYAEVEAGLWALAETTLLFLSHLGRITWAVGGICGEVERVQHGNDHLEVLKKRNRETVVTSHYLRFDEPVRDLEKQRMSVAFALDFLPGIQDYDHQKSLAAQLKVVPAAPGQVAVFFPAEKETSGLRFHLHAPFVPELSRASIKETPANLPLFQQIAVLAARSLHQIRDLGLLTVDFLASLPNPHDTLPQRYDGIRAAMVKEMNHECLTPTYAKSYAPAKHLLQGKASLKELFTETDLNFLVDHDIPHNWAITAPQKNSNADRFLGGLAITEWNVEAFVELLDDKACGWYGEPDEEFMAWLGAKSLDWHQQLYAFLYRELEQELHWPFVDEVKIIRLADGNYSKGSECYFPRDAAEHDDILPRVDSCVYSSGKSKMQQENARRFLEKSGVREVGDLEQVKAILARRYEGERFDPKKDDLRRFVALVENEPKHAALFSSYSIFEGEDGYWRKPGQIFIDSPLRETGLSEYYAVSNPPEICTPLATRYQNCCVSTNRLIKFAELVGAQTCMKTTVVSCCGNPQWSYLCTVGGERNTSPIDEDHTIIGLEQLLAKRTVAASRLVWRTMFELPPSRLRARFRRNLSNGSHHADSQLVHILRAAAWVPQTSGSFVRPTAAFRDLLPEGFPFDSGWEWLRSVHFGQDAAKKSEEQRLRVAAAKNLGFPDGESLERAKRFILLPPEEQERILLDLERRAARELPESEPPNPQRRAERVGAEATDAPERRSETRTRAVSIGLEGVKQEASQYLRLQYTNADGDLICQVCKALMPFKLDDGSDYFEKVEFLSDLEKRYYQNYLALCPNHAAMFQHANGSRDLLREMFSKVSGNQLEIVLAQHDASIYFTKTHIADLKSLISIDEKRGVRMAG